MLCAWNFTIESSPLLRPFRCCIEITAALDVPTWGLLDAVFPDYSVFKVGVRIAHDGLSKILQAMAVVMGRHVRVPCSVPIVVDSVS